MTTEMQKILTMAANYSISHDITNKDILARLTVIIIQETLKVVGGKVLMMQDELNAAE